MTLAAEPPHMMSVTFPNNAAAAAVAAAAAMAAAQHNNGVVHQIVFTILNSRIPNLLSHSAHANNQFYETRIFVYLPFEYFYQIKL